MQRTLSTRVIDLTWDPYAVAYVVDLGEWHLRIYQRHEGAWDAKLHLRSVPGFSVLRLPEDYPSPERALRAIVDMICELHGAITCGY